MRKFLFAAVAAMSIVASSNATTDDFEAWLQTESRISVTRLNANISAPGTRRGIVLASPSQNDPNYYYFWVRDGAMVMRAILDRVEQGDRLAENQFKDYIALTRENQLDAARAVGSLGEPRINVDGTVNTEPWGRPQNDGPALRAITMIRYANLLLAKGDRAAVIRDLYAAEMPARSVIKTDLEFIAHHWQDACVDLWEEVKGRHFFTEAAMMVALRNGARLAREMGDPDATSFYLRVSDQIEDQLAKHWDANRGYLLSTLEFSAGADHQKPSQLDVSVLLAALFVEQPTGLLSVMDDHIIATAEALESAFASLYPINSVHGPTHGPTSGGLGTAIGRYTEDHYYGGNPWVLSTVAFAEWNYRMAAMIQAEPSMRLTDTQAAYLAKVVGRVSKPETAQRVRRDFARDAKLRSAVVEALKLNGDSYLKRVRASAGVTGHLAEQFDLRTGQMLSAHDLSWSYAAFLRAAQARAELK
jgi:glucoamylase